MRTGWWDVMNPFDFLGDQIADAVTGVWTMMMMALWNTGLWVLRLEFSIIDALTTPDLSGDGPARSAYQVTFWLAGALVVVLLMIQLGTAAFRRNGESFARALIGTAQFGIVPVAWITYTVTLVTACGGLTKAMAKAMLGVDMLSQWRPWADFSPEDISDAVVATLLGLMGLLLWLAALGRLLVMIMRAIALLAIATTGPIAAAGLVWEGGRAWFWKAVRWLHAAALTPVVMMLILGIGVQVSNGVAAFVPGETDLAKEVGTALPAILMILVSAFSPLALFKLLAFVDPGSSSGAAMRQGLSANGGIQNLLSRQGGSSNASSAGSDGRAAGESAAEESTAGRFSAAGGGGAPAGAGGSAASGGGAGASAGAGAGAGAGGAAAGSGAGAAAAAGVGAVALPVGAVLAAGAAAYGAMSRVGTQGAALVADLGNQAGVGHDVYHPDAPDFGRQRTDPVHRSTAAREGSTATANSEQAPASTAISR